MMEPGPELDKRVCEIVHIPHCLVDGVFNGPPVSTQYGPWTEKIEEWLVTRLSQVRVSVFSIEGSAENQYAKAEYAVMRKGIEGNESKVFPMGRTLLHALCLAVLAVAEKGGA